MTRDTSAVGALEALSWRGWVVLNDLARPGKDGGTFDHVLVGPGGVFVTSRKKWPGPVAIVDGELHLAGRARPRDVTEVAEASFDVLALVPDVPVHPVLCFERHQPVTGWVRNVMLCATSNVEEVLTSRPAVLGPEQVRQVAEVLKSRLEPVPPPVPESDAAAGATPWPVRVLVQAVTLALAAVLVIGLLQTRVVDEISAAVDDLIAQVASVDDDPPAKRKPAQDNPREQTPPKQDVREGTVVKGKQATKQAKDKQAKQRTRDAPNKDKKKAARRD